MLAICAFELLDYWNGKPAGCILWSSKKSFCSGFPRKASWKVTRLSWWWCKLETGSFVCNICV